VSETLKAIAVRLRSDDAEARRLAVRDVPGSSVDGALEMLAAALGDDDWRVRKEAVARVSHWPEAGAAIAVLLAALRDDDDVGRRNAAVEALAAIGRPAVAPILGDLAAGGEHLKFLIDTLGAIGEPEATPMLIRELSSEDPNLRVAAAEALRHIGGSEAKAALRQVLRSDDRPLRMAALEGLAMLQTQVPVSEVEPSLADPLLRKPALRLLGWSGDASAVAHLIDGLEDDQRNLHAAATVALATLIRNADDPGGTIAAAVGALTEDCQANVVAVLGSDDDVRRRAAVTILGASGAAAFASTLARALVDPSMAEACATALAEMGDEAIAPILHVAAQADTDLRADLYDLLGQLGLGGPRVERALVDALGGDEFVAAAAARSLGLLEVGSAGGELRAVLAELDRPDASSAASTALGRLGALGLVPEAGEWLRAHGVTSSLAEVRAASALALAEADDVDEDGAEATLTRMLADEEPYVRLAVIRALGAVDAVEVLQMHLADETDAEIVSAVRAELDDAGV
jgi:HEAT repeat protein